MVLRVMAHTYQMTRFLSNRFTAKSQNGTGFPGAMDRLVSLYVAWLPL